MKLSGWGRYPTLDCRVEKPSTEAALRSLLGDGPAVARGNGRSYGDSALNEHLTISMARFDHMLDFDGETGLLTVEAGVLLSEVIKVFLPRGWFPPVTPGTKFVTIGGMIAADVHGKNHHGAGSFGAHVEWIDLLTADGETVRCSPQDNHPLFAATVGGMGLTGIILRAAFRMIPVESAWIRQNTIVAPNLNAAMEAFEHARHWTYSVAWIDCLSTGNDMGRSLIFCGEHAKQSELDAKKAKAPFRTPGRPSVRVPFDLPSWALNRFTGRIFNAAYRWNGERKAGERLVDWDRYFYPLDAVLDWNRGYGKRGLIQFQCVLPLELSKQGLEAMLKAIAESGEGAYLAVLKLFGPQDSAFSFPMEGYTLALDFPARPRALKLVSRLEAIAVDHGGRFYLAKDASLDRETFDAADTRSDAFRTVRGEFGAAGQFASAQSERLGL